MVFDHDAFNFLELDLGKFFAEGGEEPAFVIIGKDIIPCAADDVADMAYPCRTRCFTCAEIWRRP